MLAWTRSRPSSAHLDPLPRQKAHDCLLLIHNRNGLPLGRTTRLRGPCVRIGRGEENEIVLDEDRVSRMHAYLELHGDRWVIRDEGSANWTWLADTRLQGYVALKHGDRIQIGSSIFKFLTGTDVESAAHEEICRIAITDVMTGLHNRRALQEALDSEYVRMRRRGRTLAF
jgi:two-component system, cell cycle response regulator